MKNSKKENLTISIITPTYNRGDFLEKCILSIKEQNYPYLEHIVVDGGSSDNSVEILKKYEGTYNLKWVSEKDNGCADAMAKGFEKATGDIFCWLDSDDFYLPETLKKVIDVFQKRLDVDVVFGDMFICNAQGNIVDYMKRTKFDKEAMVYLGMIMSPQATFWRKELYQKLGGLDRQYTRCSDYDFFCRIGLSGAKCYHIKQFLAVYRVHGKQLTKSVELCRAEGELIFQKFKNQKLTPLTFKLKKIKVQAKRFWYFALQGDAWYALRSVLIRTGLLPHYTNNENNTYQS
jgi:glycosyltransferase involved in cell wall biosynthesis